MLRLLPSMESRRLEEPVAAVAAVADESDELEEDASLSELWQSGHTRTPPVKSECPPPLPMSAVDEGAVRRKPFCERNSAVSMRCLHRVHVMTAS